MPRSDAGRCRRRGFTLIELIVVVSIIGLLAAIVIRQYSNAQNQAYITSMRTDLRSFALAQESHLYDFGTYTASVATLEARGLDLSPGVSITVQEATNSGWSASASHVRTLVECYLFVGVAAPVGTATTQGRVDCS